MADTPPPAAGKKGQRRKMLIYGGVAAALLVLFLLSRRGHAASQPAADSGSPSPTATPAATGVSGSGTADNSAQISSFESDLLNQLPQAIQSGVAAGIANGLPNPSDGAAGTDSANDPGGSANQGGSSLSDELTALAGFEAATATIFRGTGAGGQQKATAGGHGKTKKPTSAKKTVHPSAGRKRDDHKPEKKEPERRQVQPNKPTGRAHKRHG